MLFNSIEFLIFLPVVVFLYFLIPYRYRWVLLLAASYFFYMSWRPEYIILILISTLVDYAIGLKLAQESRQHFRRAYLILSLTTNLGILFSFKYFNFFNNFLRSAFHWYNADYPVPDLDFLLPVGISFYTFQTLSYTLDIYKRKIQPERHFGIFALFVAFFPQLVAGPIERAGNLLPQFHKKHTFDYERVVTGLQRIAWGFFKKLVIADRLALLVNNVYGNPTEFTGTPLIIATLAFAFQIYCDFSAYSDIAIGAARIMGFNLMENFRQPYYSKSIPEFWQRWHISLSTWFRDYLYIPLGGNRIQIPRWCFNIMVVFIVSGLWHGANWTFVVWGTLHGLYMIAATLWGRAAKFISWSLPLPGVVISSIKFFITFNLVTFAWVFFRANTMSDAIYIISHLFVDIKFNLAGQTIMPGGLYEFAIVLIAIAFMELMHWIQMTNHRVRPFEMRRPIWVRWSIYYTVVLVIIIFGKFGLTEFIYFQF